MLHRRGASFLCRIMRARTRLCGCRQASTGDGAESSGAQTEQAEKAAEVNKRLMSFFEEKDNWGKSEVIVGRSWRLDELRLKSNAELHKLWYILYKEKNMLLTMEAAYADRWDYFPNPERTYRVEESMENLETVISERNEVYLSTEVGASGERPSRDYTTFTGFKEKRYLTEHAQPPEETLAFENEQPFFDDDAYIFQKLWKEKLRAEASNDLDDHQRRAGKHKFVHSK